MGMGDLNIRKLTKSEIAFMATNTCKHGHTYLAHPKCYVAEAPVGAPSKRHLGFFDIETTHLKANFGYVISYRIWDDENKKMYGRELKRGELLKFKFDRELLKEMVEDFKHFTHLVVYWGKDRRHDLPFVRTRCLKAKLHFPVYGEIGIIDMYDMARNKLALHNYRLGTVCDELGIPAKGHPLKGDPWLKAQLGDPASLKYVGVHNEEDVVCMPDVLYTLEPHYRATKQSI